MKHKDTSGWGRAAAAKRYAPGGMVSPINVTGGIVPNGGAVPNAAPAPASFSVGANGAFPDGRAFMQQHIQDMINHNSGPPPSYADSKMQEYQSMRKRGGSVKRGKK